MKVVPLKYPGILPTCRSDADCQLGHYCLRSKWAYARQADTMIGCWKGSVCMGTGAYSLDAGGLIQWWCSDVQQSRYFDSPVPFSGLIPLEARAFKEEWNPIC